MKKLFTVVLLGTMVSLAACESKKAETTSTDSTAMMSTDTAAMSAATDTMMTDSTGMMADSTKK